MLILTCIFLWTLTWVLYSKHHTRKVQCLLYDGDRSAFKYHRMFYREFAPFFKERDRNANTHTHVYRVIIVISSWDQCDFPACLSFRWLTGLRRDLLYPWNYSECWYEQQIFDCFSLGFCWIWEKSAPTRYKNSHIHTYLRDFFFLMALSIF